MTCKNCGQINPENTIFCTNCGAKLPQAVAPVAEAVMPAAAPDVKTVRTAAPTATAVPAENKPLSPWAYLGYSILFAIPLVGFVMLIILSTKAARNVNLRNYARSYWCALLIGVILGIVLAIIGLILTLVLGQSLSAIFSSLASGYLY